MATAAPAGSVTTETSVGPHLCGICGKGFDRHDLRDRHTRRCIQRLNNPRKSKRKACRACAASKLGCDLGQPSCSRCLSREITCEYLVNSVSGGTSSNAANLRSAPTDNARKRIPSISHRPPLSPSQPSTFTNRRSQRAECQPSQAGNLVHQTDEMLRVSSDSILLSPGLQDRKSQNHDATAPGMAFRTLEFQPESSHSLTQGSHRTNGHQISVANINFNEDPTPWAHGDTCREPQISSTADYDFDEMWEHIPADSSMHLATGDMQPNMNLVEPATSHAGTESTTTGDSSSIFNYLNSNNGSAFDLLGSFGVPSTAGSMPPPPGSSISSFQPLDWEPPLPWPNVTDNHTTSIPDTPHSTTVAPTLQVTYGGLNQLLPVELGQTGTKSTDTGTKQTTTCPFHKIGTDDNIVQVICKYPQTMLQPGLYPPFVHHKLYKCAEGDVLEPLANAFCCVSAFNAMVPSSRKFVFATMNAERDRLAKSFSTFGDSDIDSLAIIHAMCIYQIVGFFGAEEEFERQAELQQVIFLKMVRKLANQCLGHDGASKLEETNWKKWIINETIRRTVFLANTINSASCRTRKQNPYFYEALGDTLVMNLQIPSPDVLWNAGSEEEWQAAKRSLKSETSTPLNMTMGGLIEKFASDSQERTMRTRGKSSRKQTKAGGQVKFEDLTDFTRISVAMIKADVD